MRKEFGIPANLHLHGPKAAVVGRTLPRLTLVLWRFIRKVPQSESKLAPQCVLSHTLHRALREVPLPLHQLMCVNIDSLCLQGYCSHCECRQELHLLNMALQGRNLEWSQCRASGVTGGEAGVSLAYRD